MRHLRYAFLVLAAAGIGCATTGVVGSHIERGADFAVYHTYDWASADLLPVSDGRFLANGVFVDHVHGAVDTALRARGLQRDTAGVPDLLVHYHATATRRLTLESAGGPHGPGCGGPECETRLADRDEGTVVIDVVDARTRRIVWRGWVQDDARVMLAKPARVDASLARLFDRLPDVARLSTGER
jgi:hypothetical protein